MNCPKCSREISQAGEMDIDGRMMAVYQCDHCLSPLEFDGVKFDGAWTFAVDSAGQFFDAQTLEVINLN